jgi:hypothetical protein
LYKAGEKEWNRIHYGEDVGFGEYGNSSYHWWNPTGLNTWERFYYGDD